MAGHSGPGERELEVPLALGVLALAGLGAGAALLRHLGLLTGWQPTWAARSIATGLVLAATRTMLALLLASALLALLAFTLRAVCSWRTLRSRLAYAVLPPASFDPPPEAIEAFGQQLLGARRRVLAWLDRPACAVRIRLTTTADARVLYVVEVPARFRGALFNAFATAYPGVELRALDELRERPA